MREQIQLLIQQLQSVLPSLDELEGLERRKADLATQCKSMSADLADMRRKFDGDKARLNDAQAKAQRDLDIQISDKGQQLRSLTEAVDNATKELAGLESSLNTKRVEHGQIEASFNSLRQRLG